MMALLQLRGAGLDSLKQLAVELEGITIAQEGISELLELAEHLESLAVPARHYAFDLAMVRGLGYYTGPVFETMITEPKTGSFLVPMISSKPWGKVTIFWTVAPRISASGRFSAAVLIIRS